MEEKLVSWKSVILTLMQSKNVVSGNKTKTLSTKLNAQTESIDTKVNEFATSMQEQMCSNQHDIQQMMQEQKEYIDKHLQMLMGSIQLCMSSTTKYSLQIDVLQQNISPTEGPDTKRPKHGNNGFVAANIMEDADTLQHNRGDQAPNTGGLDNG
eukprot:5000499-Ditylum_brightwellii.AAC.1